MNKTALITGASRGIGKAIAKEFATQGYDLYLTCVSSIEQLKEYAKELEQTFCIRCLAFQADMGSYEEVVKVYEQIPALDVLVNNAGISFVGLLSDMKPEEWHNVMHTNLDACFYTSKLAIPLMLQNHSGRIINISSVWGNVGASMEVAYSASKGGVNTFTKALAKELAPSNIQVNAIACGLIDTDMNKCFTPEDLEAVTAEIPADRMGNPEEIAKLAYQLATAPTYLTGQIITIDGGWT
ncbi:MAG: SDR family NAD(P)-dependent oxidoreductase [Lachnospiraceae bacterium]|nr:SDR family NAD(P)-dependent oxidoreductase [Lachnospiraceae bacterium]